MFGGGGVESHYRDGTFLGGGVVQGWGKVQYLYLSTHLSVLEYLVYGNVKVLVLDQKVLGTYK